MHTAGLCKEEVFSEKGVREEVEERPRQNTDHPQDREEVSPTWNTLWYDPGMS